MKHNPNINNKSGIYFLTRTDEHGFKYAYIGQSIHLLDRLASHLAGSKQHIDKSLKKHKLYSESNPYGWKINAINFPEDVLDQQEKLHIHRYANAGYQLRNVSLGGQGEGRDMIAETRPAKGYHDGLAQGRRTAIKQIKHIIDKHCEIILRKPDNKVSQKQYLKLMDIFNEVEDREG